MKYLQYGLLALVATAMVFPNASAIVTTNTHPYDDVANFAPVGNYRGFTYNRDTIALCNYNRAGFPPSPLSQGCVGFSFTGVTTATANDVTNWFLSVRGWCATGSPFFNPNGISIETTDVFNTVTKVNCKSNYGAGTNFNNPGSGLPQTTVTLHDTGNSYIFDHLVFNSLLP